MNLEAHLRFYPGVHIDIFRTDDNYLVETVAYSGTMYHKTLISLTNQIGCPVKCDFCKVTEMGYLRNITAQEYFQQVDLVLKNQTGVPWLDPRKKVKVGFTRAGEALLNRNTYKGMRLIAEKYQPSFQFTSVFPHVPIARTLLHEIQHFAREYQEPFQINVSLHTSDEEKRKKMMSAYPALMSFAEIAYFGKQWVEEIPQRKIDLSIVLMEDNEVDLSKLREIFHPDYFAIRFALYLPSTEETAARHTPSSLETMKAKGEEARSLGYTCIESVAAPLEQVWDTRPHSGLNMLRRHS